ncbi:MAG: Ig-like domain-containing protein, partial [Planctomycetaceae bacterium]
MTNWLLRWRLFARGWQARRPQSRRPELVSRLYVRQLEERWVLTTTPTTLGIADVSVDRNAPDENIDLHARFNDAETADVDLTYTVQANDNPALVTSTINSDAVSDTLVLQFAPGTSGIATLTIRATDPDMNSVQTTFMVTVNDDPTITAIADQSINEDSPLGPLNFTIGDVETPGTLTVTATSSDQMIIPDGNIALVDGGGGNWTIDLTPAANRSGSGTITVSVSDGTDTTIETFTVTVNAVNDAPTIALPAGAVNYTENDPATVIDATATAADVDSTDFDGGTLTVQFTANGAAEDRLAIRNQGGGAGQVGVAGGNVTFGGA